RLWPTQGLVPSIDFVNKRFGVASKFTQKHSSGVGWSCAGVKPRGRPAFIDSWVSDKTEACDSEFSEEAESRLKMPLDCPWPTECNGGGKRGCYRMLQMLASQDGRMDTDRQNSPQPESAIVKLKASGYLSWTMLRGDCMGPEFMHAVKEMFKATAVWVKFEGCTMDSEEQEQVPASVKNKVAIIGKIYTLVEYKEESVLYVLWLKLDLVANVVTVRSLPGYTIQPSKLCLETILGQTDEHYHSLEHQSWKGVIECLKTVYATNNAARIECKDCALLYLQKEAGPGHSCPSGQICETWLMPPSLYENIIDHLAAGLVRGSGVVLSEYMQSLRWGPGIHLSRKWPEKSQCHGMLPSASNMPRNVSLEYHSNTIQ
ncbi:LOW QUALITY PROTEIN: hypothetical protein U0070_009552, partial [Myodes glareolus]